MNKQELSKEAKNKPDGYTLLGTGWVSIEETQPNPQERVYMADEYQGDGDYNEEEDEYYTPEGFYEWQSGPDMYLKINEWLYV